MTPTERIQNTFGWFGFPYALFYAAKFGLRFELGGELPMAPPRFIQAFDRARAVADALFHTSKTLTVVVSVCDAERRSARGAAALKALADIGFSADFCEPERVRLNDAEYIAEFGQDLCDYWLMADFSKTPERLHALLWAAVAKEMPIQPRVKGFDRIILVDFQLGIAMHVYDDRGMDVVAVNREHLMEPYSKFSDWLRDYDRAEMNRVFS